MNTEIPLLPKSTSLTDQKNRGRTRFKIAVFAVLGVHCVALLALLMAGCNRNTDTGTGTGTAGTGSELGKSEAPGTLASNPPPVIESSNPPVAAATNPVVPEAATGTGVGAGAGSALTGNPGGVPGAVINPTPAAGGTDYKIIKNDTLGKIAKRNHVTVSSLTNANPGIDSSKLKINQVIHIPAPAVAAPAPGTGTPGTPGVTPTEPGGAEDLYVVKSGDSLIKIAHEHGVAVKALRSANALKTDRIRVGQKLKLPPKTAAATTTSGTAAPTTGAPGR